MRCCSFFAWRRIERFSCRPFSSMCFAVLSARLSADLIVSALIRACITFFPNAFPIAFSLVENHSRLVEWAVVLPFVGMACGHLRNGNSRFAPAAPLAGALLISISAVSVSCCTHLSAPDVWQLLVLGAAASLPSHAGNARLLSTSLSSGTAGAGFLMGSWMCADPLTLSLLCVLRWNELSDSRYL